MDEDFKKLAEAANIIMDLWWKDTAEGYEYWENVHHNLCKHVRRLEANAPVTISGLTVSYGAMGTVTLHGGPFTHLSPDDARALAAELIRRAEAS